MGYAIEAGRAFCGVAGVSSCTIENRFLRFENRPLLLALGAVDVAEPESVPPAFVGVRDDEVATLTDEGVRIRDEGRPATEADGLDVAAELEPFWGNDGRREESWVDWGVGEARRCDDWGESVGRVGGLLGVEGWGEGIDL